MNDYREIYTSDELFPLFENRLLNQSRPEYSRFIQWLDLDSSNTDPFTIFAKTSGLRSTDSLELVPLPKRQKGNRFALEFFCRGVRYLSECSRLQVMSLQPNDNLYIMRDIQNIAHDEAVALRTDHPATMVGYLPWYVAREFCSLEQRKKIRNLRANVVRLNTSAPSEFRLLCRIAFDWPRAFKPFSAPEFVPLNGMMRSYIKAIRGKD